MHYQRFMLSGLHIRLIVLSIQFRMEYKTTIRYKMVITIIKGKRSTGKFNEEFSYRTI